MDHSLVCKCLPRIQSSPKFGLQLIGIAADLRPPLERFRHGLGLLGQREALRRAQLGTETRNNKMDDGRIRSRNRDARLPKARRHRPPHSIARAQSTPLLHTLGYGHHLLSITHNHGHGIVVAVHAPKSAVDSYDAEKLFAADDVDGAGFLGEQFVGTTRSSRALQDS